MSVYEISMEWPRCVGCINSGQNLMLVPGCTSSYNAIVFHVPRGCLFDLVTMHEEQLQHRFVNTPRERLVLIRWKPELF